MGELTLGTSLSCSWGVWASILEKCETWEPLMVKAKTANVVVDGGHAQLPAKAVLRDIQAWVGIVEKFWWQNPKTS